LFSSHHVQREPLSMRERMTRVLDAVRGGGFVEFTQLFDITEGRLGVVVSFMAVLELIKETLIELVQTESYGPIHVKARGG
jgi:segregation and condensation protein A